MNFAVNAYQIIRWNLFWNNYRLPFTTLGELGAQDRKIDPPVKEGLFLPPYHGMQDHDDVSSLLNLVGARQPSVILELGTAYGATVANLCATSNAKIYTVNALPEQISGRITSAVLTREQIGYVYREEGYEDRVVQIYENTQNLNILNKLPSGSVDVAIIDACHDTDYVVGDFLRILPSLHSHSMVLFHDVHPSMEGHLANSYIACMYLRKMGYDIKYLRDTWWAVWRASDRKIPSTCQIAFILDTILQKLLVLRARELSPEKNAKYFRWLYDLKRVSS